MMFRLLMVYEVKLKTKCNISGVDIQLRAMNSYPFGLDEAVNEGARKTCPTLSIRKVR